MKERMSRLIDKPRSSLCPYNGRQKLIVFDVTIFFVFFHNKALSKIL